MKAKICAILFFCFFSLSARTMERGQTDDALPVRPVVIKLAFPSSGIVTRHVVVKKGTPLEIAGVFPSALGQIRLCIRERRALLTESVFDTQPEDAWKLSWDTSNVQEGTHACWVYYARGNSEEVAFARLMVDIFAEYPLKAKLEAPPDHRKAPFICTLLPGDLKPDSYSFFLDATPIKGKVENNTVYLDLSKSRTGKHKLFILANLPEQVIEMDPIPLVLPSKVKIKDFPTKNLKANNLYDLGIVWDADLKPLSVTYYIDKASIGSSSTPPFDSLKLNSSELKSGQHILYAVVQAPGEEDYYTPETLLFLPTSPNKKSSGNTANLPNRQKVKLFSSDFDEWYIQAADIINEQTAAIATVKEQLDKNYFSTASVDEAIKVLKNESAYAQDMKYAVPNLNYPDNMSGENQRSLQMALKQLGTSYIIVEQVIKQFRGNLTQLKRYDGTLTNLSNADRNIYKASVATLVRSLAAARKWVVQSASNIDLVQMRLNSR
jgi:hypothetical protein